MTKENERVKRDLKVLFKSINQLNQLYLFINFLLKHARELHSGNMKEMEARLSSLQEDCKVILYPV